MKRATGLMMIVFALTACGPAATSSPTAAPIYTPAVGSVANDALTPTGASRLVVMSHDSFTVSEEVLDAFEQANGVTVELLKAGDTGTALNQAILSANAPLADVFFGVDNTFLSRALEADIFEPYPSPELTNIPDEFELDPEQRLLPVDVGYVTINYDRAALTATGLAAPSELRELTSAAWRGKLVVQNPATSSPGLAFLLATIATFGEEGDYTWRDFWRELRTNEVYISNDWTDAYYTQFSGSSGKGPYPLVVSYSTSPAAEVFFSEGALSDAPTANLFVAGSSFRQIEFVGILKGTERRALAERFVDFVLQEQFQNDIPLQMFVYPVNEIAQVPALFTQFAPVPEQAAELAPELIEANRERWIQEWTEIMLR
ncbi:thiamine ABC transporter substrate-binding protein [Candidatus Gracilibacteria bacterium]|nr:thiamine ABC transporter substrate-binding protein [Candidatus Gracilibacteria bacterium]